ncbi:lysozyme [Photobacterium kishitanii]|uniref:lysozyme n=1 Tax=Photobacterium kishitanii TaxID=318456 RepID=UPI000D16882B|nr:lysozyme [Photobacterium kishitanii]PSW62974.1 lysozyme [Photobacterium kishitanii]
MNKLRPILCSITAVIALLGNSGVGNSALPIGNVVIAGENQGKLNLTYKGLKLIGDYEGCRLDAYRCPAGYKTNGIGNIHNITTDIIDNEQVAKDWVSNIQQAESCLNNVIGSNYITQGQYDALTSFIFNTGCKRFLKNKDLTATKISTYVRAGKMLQACLQLSRWVYGGGKKLKGLVKRRMSEYSRCIE